MQKQLSSSVLTDPTHALAFVDNALASSTAASQDTHGSQDRLRFVNREEDRDENNEDLLRTAIDFLLSSLEGMVPAKN